jgi:tetratricopeptide (TPR) repeat protein
VENASTSIVLVHYFGNSKHPGLGATTRFATTLLARLFHEKSLKRDRRFGCVVQRILKLATRYDSGVESPHERLLDILDQVFELLSDFTLVVDALDECTNPEVCGAAELYCLISYLKRLASGNKGRVIILSRTATLSEEDFSDTHRISMDGDIVKHDIMCYVNEEIRQNGRRNSGLEELKDEILAKVSKDCQGTFLWAKYVMDELKTTTTTNGIRARLNEFPAKVVDFYRRELKEGNGRLHELERIQRHDTLSLVAGTLEPLYVRDIAEMLALDTGTNEIEKGNLLANPAVDVPRICCPFLTVMKDQVQFVHEAAESAVRDFEVTRKASDALLAMKCLSKLSQSEYVEWSCPARLLRRNLRATGDIDDDSERSFKESVTYRYACLYWQKHVTALKDPSNEILVKLAEFFGSNAFVTWSETLLLLKPNSGVGAHVQIRTLLQGWLDTIPPDRQRKIPIESFFVKPHEQLKDEFNDKAGDRILPYLPLVRLGQYFNVGGRNNQDHWRAYRYKMVVAAGFEDVLGHRHPLTLRARTEVYKEYFYQKRFDEAEHGLTEIVEAQREVIGEDDIDYYFTLQLLGSVQLCLADFERSIATLSEAADGFRRLSGKDYLYTLQTEFYIGLALERTPRLVEADDIYERLLQVFVPDGGASHPFSLMLKTARGSVLRKLGRYVEAENVLLESFNARKALFTNEDVITIDSALQLAALFYERERESEGTKYLDFVSRTEIVKDEFERHCQEQHIRALIAFGTGSFSEPIAALQRLLSTVSGDGRDKNNRELQWARITLADALRQAGNDDEALIVFSDLVTPLADEYVPSSEVEETEQLAKFPSTLAAEPESRRQLELAEKALRLAKAAEPEKAELLLRDNGLKWLRKADFWALAGGPITDTASMSGLDAEDYVIIDLSTTMGAGNPLLR